MFRPATPRTAQPSALDSLSRLAIVYVTLPLFIFLGSWLVWWAAVPLLICAAYALRPLLASRAPGSSWPVTRLQVGVAVLAGCTWAFLGGTDHLVFANADWHVRDAVLHDLVISPWPVGYGPWEGAETLLRTSIAYYLPAALAGKALGLAAAHGVMLAWTALGAILFLLLVMSLTPSRLRAALLVTAVVVLFSGLDIVGALLDSGPRFQTDWNITTHLEWWAGTYQYSSMTTQLFWVPNHALGGWLLIGLLCRDDGASGLETVLPILLVALALWSPLTFLGVLPFAAVVAWRALQHRSLELIHPRIWLPALAVGVAVAAYLALDPAQIRKGLAVGEGSVGDTSMNVLRQAQFFLLEAGFIGIAMLWLRRSLEVALALVILALLPLAYFGPGNDLVMRASIPSLAVLAIGACLALIEPTEVHGMRKKAVLGGLLAIGAMTPVAEFARAVMLPVWPINMDATLIGADCGGFAPHYVARLTGSVFERVLRKPNRIALGPQGPQSCYNPAVELMWGTKRRWER